MLLLVAIVADGALRKWLLPQGLHPLAYLSKHVIAVVIIVRDAGNPKHPFETLSISAGLLFLASFVIGLTEDFTAASLTYLNLLIWPLLASRLIWAGPHRIRLMILGFSVLTVMQAPVVALQYLSPPDAVVNRYVGDSGSSADIATFGRNSLVRATGTFSYITGLGTWCSTGLLLLVGVRATRLFQGDAIWHNLGLVSAALAILATGSRAPLFIPSVCIILGSLASARVGVISRVVLVVGLLVAAYSSSASVQSLVENYWDRVVENNEESMQRIGVLGGAETMVSYLATPSLGEGLGTQSTVRAIGGARRGVSLEIEDDNRLRIARESGQLGMVGFVGVLALILNCSIQAVSLCNVRFRFLAVSLASAAVISAYVFSYPYDHVGAAVMWGMLVPTMVALSRYIPATGNKAREMTLTR